MRQPFLRKVKTGSVKMPASSLIGGMSSPTSTIFALESWIAFKDTYSCLSLSTPPREQATWI